MSIEVSGLKEVQAAMKKLPGNVQRRVSRSATRAGAVIIRKLAVSNIPVRQNGKLKRASSGKLKGYRYPGYLKKNIGIIRNESVPKNIFSFKVAPIRFAFYGRFLELGTSHQAAKPWLRPAYESGKTFAYKRIRERMLRGIEREVKRLSAK